MGNGRDISEQQPPFKLLLRQHMCPGDAVVSTAAVESLHRAYPGTFVTKVQTTAQAIWDNNPRHTPSLINSECHVVDMEYPGIHDLSIRQIHFMTALCEHLGRQIKRPVPLLVKHPLLYFSEAENKPLSYTQDWKLPYCCINAGHKLDFTAKYAGFSTWQKVVDHFKGRLAFVQVGEANPYHNHRPLEGALNFIGLTPNYRDLFRLCKYSLAGIGPVSLLLHVYGALEKPYVCVAGGREEMTWEAYSTTQYLHTLGQLDCCKEKACWKSRTVNLDDSNTNNNKLCTLPVLQEGEYIPKCLQMIGSEGVINALEQILRR